MDAFFFRALCLIYQKKKRAKIAAGEIFAQLILSIRNFLLYHAELTKNRFIELSLQI
jgi:hypothetical protein